VHTPNSLLANPCCNGRHHHRDRPQRVPQATAGQQPIAVREEDAGHFNPNSIDLSGYKAASQGKPPSETEKVFAK
jgi:hypothetical protein